MKKLFAVIALSAMLAACAGSGSIRWDNARQVKAGMTKQEVGALMGQPYSVQTVDKGSEKWVWVHVTPFGGAESAHLTFKDGKVTQAWEIPESFK